MDRCSHELSRLRSMHATDSKRSQRGNVLVVSLAISVFLAGFATAALTVVTSAYQEERSATVHQQRLYLAEAALNNALVELMEGDDGNVGTAVAPQALGQGTFFATTVDNGDGTFTITAQGTQENGSRIVQGVVRRTGGPFANALFAGNASADPNYVMEFGGTGASADDINGDVYSGGDITVSDDADMDGDLRAHGTITGASGEEGEDQGVPDLSAMDYENNHDIDVAAEFTTHGVYQSDDAGGSAYQLPESNPGHIFRKNPSDRTSVTNATTKDDYFLEDPYEPPNKDSAWDGSDAYMVTLSGMGSEPGVNSNNKVFFIDGNLWIHNYPTYSFKFASPGSEALRTTFVIKGNLYIGDNIFYDDMDEDGVAFITIEDENVPDSGNIYFGDPSAGTLETMHSYMYAENDFIDNNMDKSGADQIIVYGTMSAGNHVAIDRNFATQYSKFVMNFDDRLLSGGLELPGLPNADDGAVVRLVLWQEISAVP